MKKYYNRYSRFYKYDKVINIIIAVFLITMFGLVIFSTLSNAEILINKQNLFPSTITTPTDLGNWLSQNFTYKEDENDYWQSPEETVKLKSGDCEDSSILVDYILKKLGYDTTILALYFSDRTGGHAITIVKIEGYYTFFSNNTYFTTTYKSLRTLLNSNYPYWSKVYYLNPDRPNKGILLGTR